MSPDDVLGAYRRDSHYLRQLATNDTISDLLRCRLQRWLKRERFDTPVDGAARDGNDEGASGNAGERR